jgi:hypothetical protein
LNDVERVASSPGNTYTGMFRTLYGVDQGESVEGRTAGGSFATHPYSKPEM